MSIKLNEQKVVAAFQVFSFRSVFILNNNSEEGVTASVIFDVKNERGDVIGVKTIQYSGDEFNRFWKGFLSGKFLYDELVAKENLDIVVPDTVEEEFGNQKKEISGDVDISKK